MSHSFAHYIASLPEHGTKKVSVDEDKMLYELFFQDLKPVNPPNLVIFAGGPGTGKTTFRNKKFSIIKNYHLHDMDEVLIRLKGYQEDHKKFGSKKAFENHWETARTISERLVRYAFLCKFNVLYDRTCGSNTSLNDLKEAILNHGYKAKMYAFTLPIEQAVCRVKTRERTAGRTVTLAMIAEYMNRFSHLFPMYLSFIDEVHLFYGDREIFVKKHDKTEMLDEALYKDFLDTGTLLSSP